MPTYEYLCEACDHSFDEFQAMKDAPLTKCPRCKKKKLRRVIGAGAALLFKGSGFYITDYRSDSYQSAAKAEQEATKPAAESKGETKSEGPSSEQGAGKKHSGGSSSKSKPSK